MSIVFTSAALQSECQTDPSGLGLTALFTAAQDQAIADLLNSLVSPGAASVMTDRLPKSSWLFLIAQGGLMVATLGAQISRRSQKHSLFRASGLRARLERSTGAMGTDANQVVEKMHDRMPVIIQAYRACWADC